VFSVPSRRAIYADDFREACRIALETSDPPRKVSKQLFMIAPKIREIDAVLRADAGAADRVFEVHPELAFWRLNGERALEEPKKVKGTPYGPGLALRRGLLVGAIPAVRRTAARGRRGRSPRYSPARPSRDVTPGWRAPFPQAFARDNSGCHGHLGVTDSHADPDDIRRPCTRIRPHVRRT
jgi:hypothetical protein